MADATSPQEELLNAELARLLTGLEVPAEPERREGGKRMDVVADVDGLRVVLEAEPGFHRKRRAIADADARLKQGLTNIVFAVCYPAGATVEGLSAAEVTWTVRARAGAAEGEWSTGSIRQIAQAVRQAPRSLSGADIAAQMLSDGLDAAVQRLSAATRRAIAQTLDLPADENGGYFTAAKRGMLVVSTAMLFHHRLHGYLPDERPSGFDGEWPPMSARMCAEESVDVVSEHSEAWRAILAVDYKPVFMTGRAALGALPANPDNAQAVRNLASVVERVAGRIHGLRHDLLGRIFHRVLDTARYDGSFYTSTAAAVLLAELALRERDADWSDPNAIGNLRVCDPACGTGTLLMAVAERVRDLRRAAGSISAEDEEALALLLVEDVLWGYDVNLTATHMAASTLGMLSPSTQFSRMRVFRALLGVYDGVAYLGSLEFLNGGPRLAAWPAAAQQVEDDQPEEPPPPMDLVVMNPPFTRDSLRHDQFTREEEEQIKRREKQMLDGQPHRSAARLSGSANAFLVLADKLLAKENATLAVVLPTVMATNPAAVETRRHLAARFHVDLVVASHDPRRIFFSEDTAIGEMLLVCRRWSAKEPKPPTLFVNLSRNPSEPVMSLDLARRIRRVSPGEAQASDDPFTTQWIDADRVAEGDWNAVNFFSPYLVENYRTLADGWPKLSDLADIGPAGRRIRDAYRRVMTPTRSGRRALWRHDTETTQTMRAETDSHVEPIPSKRRLANSYWGQRSRLLLPERMRLNTARVASVLIDPPAVGSLWIPCRPHDPAAAESMCLYLNSSVGLLALLGGRGNRIPSYPAFSIDALRSMPAPDFAALDADALARMTAAFDELRGETLQPLPMMSGDPVRQRIDAAVAEGLGLDGEWVAGVREALAKEPSVTNRRYAP